MEFETQKVKEKKDQRMELEKLISDFIARGGHIQKIGSTYEELMKLHMQKNWRWFKQWKVAA